MEMGIWGIALIIGIVAMVFGPIMMLQPNPVQRRQRKLRSHALSSGFKVSMKPLPKAIKNREAGTMLPVYTYLCPREEEQFKPWLLIRSDYAHESHFHDYWEWQEKAPVNSRDIAWLNQVVSSVPDSVMLIGGTPQGVHWYWTESGGEDTLHQLQLLSAKFPS